MTLGDKTQTLIPIHGKTNPIESVSNHQQSLQLLDQPSAEELSIVLGKFVVEWEQNVMFGDHRWERENIMTMQSVSKKLLTDLVRLNSKQAFSSTDMEEMQPLVNELHEFVMVDVRGPRVQEFEPAIAHGRKAYEMAREVISVRPSLIKAKEMRWCLCGHNQEIHNDAVCLFSYNNEGFPFDIDCECPSFRAT
jgi:hypothetical protein